MTTWLPTLLLVLARTAGIFLVAPVFSHSVVPGRMRYFLAVGAALAVVGRVGQAPPMPGWFDLLAAVACEAALGAVIGGAARLVLAGVELGALQIGQQTGLELASALEAGQDEPSDVVRRAMHILAAVIFLGIGGHRVVIASLLRTFQTVPPAGFAPGRGVLDAAVSLLGASFALGLKTAAPVLIAMLLATAALGAIQRALPQCNILTVGLTVRAALGLLVLAASLGLLGDLIEAGLARAMADVSAVTSGGS